MSVVRLVRPCCGHAEIINTAAQLHDTLVVVFSWHGEWVSIQFKNFYFFGSFTVYKYCIAVYQ